MCLIVITESRSYTVLTAVAFSEAICCLHQKLLQAALPGRAGPVRPQSGQSPGARSLPASMGPGKPLGASRDLAVPSCADLHSSHPWVSDGTLRCCLPLRQLKRRLDGQDSSSLFPGLLGSHSSVVYSASNTLTLPRLFLAAASPERAERAWGWP